MHVSVERILTPDLPCAFGRYVLLDVLGEGGMARVFRAELHGPAGFRKLVALKVIKPGVGAKANQTETMDLIREGCLGGRLKHPHIVDVYELGEWEGNLFLSMELVDGVTLSELIRAERTIPISVALEIATAMASGLAKAHTFDSDGRNAGLVHRDLKPPNILLSWDGAVKIADFGIAITKEHLPDPNQEEAGLFGTPDYMSPEQVTGKTIDHRSDIFSVGIILYHSVSFSCRYHSVSFGNIRCAVQLIPVQLSPAPQKKTRKGEVFRTPLIPEL